jgi:hypothetical protein
VGVFLGKGATGGWTLFLPDTQATRSLFVNKEIDDVRFVIAFAGVTPAWPMF